MKGCVLKHSPMWFFLTVEFLISVISTCLNTITRCIGLRVHMLRWQTGSTAVRIRETEHISAQAR
jgi:hypothetical protein